MGLSIDENESIQSIGPADNSHCFHSLSLLSTRFSSKHAGCGSVIKSTQDKSSFWRPPKCPMIFFQVIRRQGVLRSVAWFKEMEHFMNDFCPLALARMKLARLPFTGSQMSIHDLGVKDLHSSIRHNTFSWHHPSKASFGIMYGTWYEQEFKWSYSFWKKRVAQDNIQHRIKFH